MYVGVMYGCRCDVWMYMYTFTIHLGYWHAFGYGGASISHDSQQAVACAHGYTSLTRYAEYCYTFSTVDCKPICRMEPSNTGVFEWNHHILVWLITH